MARAQAHACRVEDTLGNDCTERAALEAITPAQYKRYAHHWLILHGRYVCKARKPECPDCVLADLCRYPAKTGAPDAAAPAQRAAGARLSSPPRPRAPARRPR